MIAVVTYDLPDASSEDYEKINEELSPMGIEVQQSVWIVEFEATPDQVLHQLEELMGPRAKILVAPTSATSVVATTAHHGGVANWIIAHRR